jgi:DNA polymerase-1
VHAKDIDGVVGENLRNTLEWLKKSRELLTIKCDVVLPVCLKDLGLQPQDKKKLFELYERLDFRTWLRELQKDTNLDSKSSSSLGVNFIQSTSDNQEAGINQKSLVEDMDTNYQTILSKAQLEEWIEHIKTYASKNCWHIIFCQITSCCLFAISSLLYRSSYTDGDRLCVRET